jgi:hypothetical protein
MSATIERPDPTELWKGHAEINLDGVRLVLQMMGELEDIESEDFGVTTAEFCDLEDWPREGRPFRNIFAEYLARARAAGTDVEAGFCAVDCSRALQKAQSYLCRTGLALPFLACASE